MVKRLVFHRVRKSHGVGAMCLGNRFASGRVYTVASGFRIAPFGVFAEGDCGHVEPGGTGLR
jgi:hypothetical protein